MLAPMNTIMAVITNTNIGAKLLMIIRIMAIIVMSVTMIMVVTVIYNHVCHCIARMSTAMGVVMMMYYAS